MSEYFFKPQTQEMNRKSTLTSKVISILTHSNLSYFPFTQGHSFLRKHQFIQPALVLVSKKAKNQYFNFPAKSGR
jgi:hypothetical protein